ncbi:MAG: phosphoribosyl-ATP diphosphatase [Hyphomicrobiales bacterium]|nr:phosphoribosyl-ATP diphosphatase [Hyphomicrobiales bacterium]
MSNNTADTHVLDALFGVIMSRKDADPDVSYTARLLAKGPNKITKKLGEEAVELVIAALTEDRTRIASESADLLYHLLVLWAETDVEPAQVWRELERREGVSGLAEKASRGGKK